MLEKNNLIFIYGKAGNYKSSIGVSLLNSIDKKACYINLDNNNHFKINDNIKVFNEVSDIDFVGGDHTTYETGWKTAEIDLSQYAGQTVTLNFIIYDVGDEIYDSACVIDNVVVQ